MDKVIIDGVDVSECDSYTSNYREPMPYGEIKVTKHYCWHINSNCDGKDCDFKQIKRLQADYEDLRLTYAGCKTANTGLQELNQKLEQENEKLKQVVNDSIIEQEKLIAKVNELQAENERLKEENYGLNQELLGYKKGVQASEIVELKYTLQEIREIVSEPCIVDENCQTCNSGCMQKDILAKINEVIGAE